MDPHELLDKIRDVVGPQCEDASAAVLAVRELLGLSPKSGESVFFEGDHGGTNFSLRQQDAHHLPQDW